MSQLYNDGPAVTTGPWVEVPAGLVKLVAEIPVGDAATVTFEQKIGEGEAHPVHVSDALLILADGSPAANHTTTGATKMRVKRAGGTATFPVKALIVPTQ